VSGGKGAKQRRKARQKRDILADRVKFWRWLHACSETTRLDAIAAKIEKSQGELDEFMRAHVDMLSQPAVGSNERDSLRVKE